MSLLPHARQPNADDLTELLAALRRAGEKPDQALLDRMKAHGQAAVRPLVEMAVDEQLLEAEGPEGWAPPHAVRLLGELGAAEAVEPLLPLFDRVEDDLLGELLPEAYAGFGAPAVAPLRALLFDRAHNAFARGRAATALGKIGQRHPATRADVVSALVARLDPAESRVPDDEMLNGFVISELVDLEAVEALPAINQAFDEDRVDTFTIDRDDALVGLGVAPRPARTRKDQQSQQGVRLRLCCTVCHYEREHHVARVLLDLGTHERQEKGEPTPYSAIVIAQHITCPKCGARDQYKLAGQAYISLMAEILKKAAASKRKAPGGAVDKGPFQFVRAGLVDGRPMHPYEARDMYREAVAAEPANPDLRVRYGAVLRTIGWHEEAVEQYQAALRLDPTNLEALLNLGQAAQTAGNRVEALRMFESLMVQAQRSQLPPDERALYLDAAAAAIVELTSPPERAAAVQRGVRSSAPAPARAPEPGLAPLHLPGRVVPKVGRNEPCPCGSGKKYKKCHGR